VEFSRTVSPNVWSDISLDVSSNKASPRPVEDFNARQRRMATTMPMSCQSTVRRCKSSGNISVSSMHSRYAIPAVPPVPRLSPITRSTVVT